MKNRYELLVETALDVSADLLSKDAPGKITAVANDFQKGDRIAVTCIVSIHGGVEILVDMIDHEEARHRVSAMTANQTKGNQTCH